MGGSGLPDDTGNPPHGHWDLPGGPVPITMCCSSSLAHSFSADGACWPQSYPLDKVQKFKKWRRRSKVAKSSCSPKSILGLAEGCYFFFWKSPIGLSTIFGESIGKTGRPLLFRFCRASDFSKVLPFLSKGQIDFEFCRSCGPRSFGACRYEQAAIGERPCSYHGLHGKDHWRPDCPSFVHRGQVRWWLRPSLSCSSAACRFCALQFA